MYFSLFKDFKKLSNLQIIEKINTIEHNISFFNLKKSKMQRSNFQKEKQQLAQLKTLATIRLLKKQHGK